MEGYTVYILKSETVSKFYSGLTQCLAIRLAEHNAGKSKFTSAYVPWKVIYTENFGTMAEARKREKYFKTAAGRRFVGRIANMLI